MATITEDYVSFEAAKLLKEKGFYQDFLNETTPVWKLNGNKEELAFYGDDNYPCEWEEWYFAPTLQMAMKWLREVHNWTICISPYWPEGDMRNKFTWYYDIHSLIDNRSFRESCYTDNYIEATEAAIEFCLENLI